MEVVELSRSGNTLITYWNDIFRITSAGSGGWKEIGFPRFRHGFLRVPELPLGAIRARLLNLKYPQSAIRRKTDKSPERKPGSGNCPIIDVIGPFRIIKPMSLNLTWIDANDYDRLAAVRVQCYAPTMAAKEKF